MDNQTRDSIRIAAVQMFAQKRAGFLQDAGKFVAEQWGKLNPTAQGAVIGGLGGGTGGGLLAYLTGRNVLTGVLGGGAAGAGVGAGIQYLRHRGDKPGAQPPAAIAPVTPEIQSPAPTKIEKKDENVRVDNAKTQPQPGKGDVQLPSSTPKEFVAEQERTAKATSGVDKPITQNEVDVGLRHKQEKEQAAIAKQNGRDIFKAGVQAAGEAAKSPTNNLIKFYENSKVELPALRQAEIDAGIRHLRQIGVGAKPFPHYTATPEGGALLKADRDLISAALSEQGLGKAVTPEQIKALSRMREVAQYLQSNGYKDLGGDVLFKTISGLEN